MYESLAFYSGKRVLITGHTGFKGTWLTKILVDQGAIVTGYSLNPQDETNLWDICGLHSNINHIVGDVRDLEKMKSVFSEYKPEIVFHLAAQPIVREGYKNPVYTYETNVLGTLNLLECVRLNTCVKSVINITTDKVYANKEINSGYTEEDPLDGYDPYSNSKSCSELVTHCYKKSFLDDRNIAVSTVRAGNVIGGGDFSIDRIMPDCIRAVSLKKSIIVRNPYSVRPYQHVLEPLFVYLHIAKMQYGNTKFAGYYNVGPDVEDCKTTGELVDIFCRCWGEDASWTTVTEKNAPHEARLLQLDCTKIKNTFAWSPKWNAEQAVGKVCEFSKVLSLNGDVLKEMEREIADYCNCF